MRALFWILIVSVYVPSFAHAEDYCSKLGRTPTQVTRCHELQETYEIDPLFVAACAGFSDSDEARMDCLKSGAAEPDFKTCKALGWSEENTLTCLRSLPNKVLAQHCKNFSAVEDSQVSCLRAGREISQVDTCRNFSENEAEKIACLKYEIPSMAIYKCKKSGERIACLDDYKAGVERAYQAQRRAEKKRSLASEGKPVEAEPIKPEK